MGNQAALKVIGVISLVVLALFALSVASGVINFGAEAIQETKRVLSVDNIREQRTAIIEDWQELLVAAGNACNAVSAPPNQHCAAMIIRNLAW